MQSLVWGSGCLGVLDLAAAVRLRVGVQLPTAVSIEALVEDLGAALRYPIAVDGCTPIHVEPQVPHVTCMKAAHR